jgi:hypothetical protein
MSETMTYDPGTDTVTTEQNLTPEEQNSLEVGTELEAQQENLLAGKYKNAQELEKAYAELESKLGTQEAEKTEEVSTDEAPETEASDFIEYLDDGSINFDQVNESYGEQLGNIFKDNNVDPWAISKHFHENQGEITEEMYGQLESAGLSRDAIDAYLDGRAVQSGYRDSATDLAATDVDVIKNSVGGEAEYNQMTAWAAANLDQNVIEAFDNLLDTGDANAIQLAVTGLKAQYENATGYEGKMYTGKAPKSSGDVFRSQPELVAAMSDPRYDQDPAYRQDVIEKLDRSDLAF